MHECLSPLFLMFRSPLIAHFGAPDATFAQQVSAAASAKNTPARTGVAFVSPTIQPRRRLEKEYSGYALCINANVYFLTNKTTALHPQLADIHDSCRPL